MNVRDIMIRWLREHRYDGLRYADEDCSCELDDLMIGCAHARACEPARRVRCRCVAGCERCDDLRWLMATDEEVKAP